MDSKYSQPDWPFSTFPYHHFIITPHFPFLVAVRALPNDSASEMSFSAFRILNAQNTRFYLFDRQNCLVCCRNARQSHRQFVHFGSALGDQRGWQKRAGRDKGQSNHTKKYENKAQSDKSIFVQIL